MLRKEGARPPPPAAGAVLKAACWTVGPATTGHSVADLLPPTCIDSRFSGSAIRMRLIKSFTPSL